MPANSLVHSMSDNLLEQYNPSTTVGNAKVMNSREESVRRAIYGKSNYITVRNQFV